MIHPSPMLALALATVVWFEMLRRKDLYVMVFLLAAMLALLASLNIFGLGQMVGYVKEIGLAASWVLSCVLAVSLGARQLPQEETRGTLYPLLAKPVSRTDVLCGKWLGASSIVIVATFLFYLLTALLVILRGGSFRFIPVAQAFLLHGCVLCILSALAVLFSTRLNADAAATLTFIAAGVSFFIVPRIPAVLAHISGWRSDALLVIYHLLPHFEVFDMRQRIVHNYGPVPWATFGAIIGYGTCLTVLCLAVASALFARKRLSRGNML
jgi:ABC-type transport system involved in multi-copper enzyme maturation permease subunit